MVNRGLDTTIAISYIAMFFALKQLLSLHHRIPLADDITVRREDFIRSWKNTAATPRL